MKVAVVNNQNQKVGDVELPAQFNEDIRPDIVKRAVVAMWANKQQPYGAKDDAGMRASAEISRRRKNYRGSYGFGISRVPRKILSRRGTRMNWVGAVAPGTVGGRRAHPPKPVKDTTQKVNVKERKKAIRSALAATVEKKTVADHGYKVPEAYPIIVDETLNSVSKTKDAQSLLKAVGLENELVRVDSKQVRAGRGKSRGRRYKTKCGPLIVVNKITAKEQSFANIPGVDVVEVKNLNAEMLAPGAIPGRLTIWTKAALETIQKDKLFM